MKTELFSIGDLSKIVGVSTDTLRYCDEIELLKSAKTSRIDAKEVESIITQIKEGFLAKKQVYVPVIE